ncbi:biotin--[acetyl-CoA-carboxylase] ligase [Pseudonocardia hydrocarbonoxydans]|uniref:biotin--[biotin carboxyl-carrier protein] ligase n=1 Tax=Pseudonocardia hydrocarbonoxydans TaxID=76726 RepID=A0A4Y3WNN0_9PSEU|nr:biotin--[acetyl-CoA-carboxylase] ligase [Pseudonocardia hydrocarbonoxydans]GEC20512.1 biotin--[acetyl-CoA-carboxylase] ligase [Pseudonocardia hydrocarbonoxydans]
MNRTAQPLDVGALRAALVGPWAQLDVVERTGSTNADLMAAALAGAPDRTVLVAEHQESGRGRLARSWVSPPGSGLTVSVLLRPSGVSPSRFGWLPLLAGLAVLDAVRAVTDVPAGLKWPNDLLVGREPRKVAGILAEVADPSRPAVVVGIGINVDSAPPDQPTATSLTAESGRPVDRTAVLVELLTRLHEREAAWRAGRGDPETTRIRADYRAGCLSLGSPVRVELPGGASVSGIAEDVDGDGRLLLLDATGHRRAVAAGDVVHLRPADRAHGDGSTGPAGADPRSPLR